MTHTLGLLVGIAHRNGWNVKPITYSNGDPGGFIATRSEAAITITTNRRGRILDIKHTEHPYTTVKSDRAGIAAGWLKQGAA